MADNSWLCSHVITRHGSPIPARTRPQFVDSQATRNIPGKYVKNWESNGGNLGSEAKSQVGNHAC